MIKRIIVILILCYSCKSEYRKSNRVIIENIRFETFDSAHKLDNNYKVIFYFKNDSVTIQTKKDSIVFNALNDVSNVGIRFIYGEYDLKFDSIPYQLFLLKQHKAFEFGITKGSIFSHKKSDPNRLYKYFTLNHWDSGLGRYFEKPL